MLWLGNQDLALDQLKADWFLSVAYPLKSVGGRQMAFKCRRVEYDLFGDGFVDRAREPFHRAFADSPQVQFDISVGQNELELISEELGLHSDCLVSDGLEYVEGNFRDKADGLAGGRLGDFGEVMAYLTSLAKHGRTNVTRIVGYKRGAQADRRYPQPDFLVSHGSGVMGVLEVKTTQAVVFQKLRKPNKRQLIEACKGALKCRDRALKQLGLVKGNLPTFLNLLKVRSGHIVRFPTHRIDVMAVLLWDGRMNGLSISRQGQLSPPMLCNLKGRSCWDCFNIDRDPTHVTFVEMGFDPSYLLQLQLLLGDSSNWYNAYRLWALSLDSGSTELVHEKSDDLAVASGRLMLTVAHEGGRLGDSVAAWARYISEATAEHGYAPSQRLYSKAFESANLGRPTEEVYEFASPNVSRTTFQELASRLQRFGIRECVGRHSIEGLAHRHFGCMIETKRVSLMLTARKWDGISVLRKDVAESLAGEVASLALELLAGNGQENPESMGRHIPLQLANAFVGDTKVHLGWSMRGIPSGSDGLLSAEDGALQYWLDRARTSLEKRGIKWLSALFFGDPRVSMVVLADGRARLRIAAELL